MRSFVAAQASCKSQLNGVVYVLKEGRFLSRKMYAWLKEKFFSCTVQSTVKGNGRVYFKTSAKVNAQVYKKQEGVAPKFGPQHEQRHSMWSHMSFRAHFTGIGNEFLHSL